jgi:hypothetical protein
MPYNPVDDRTYAIVEGDTWLYRDLAAEGQPFDQSVAIPLMAASVDESGWLSGPQPFVAAGATSGTYTEFGDMGGPVVASTAVATVNPGLIEGFFIAARKHFTIPAGTSRWIIRAQFGIFFNVYLDGAFIAQFTGVGYDGASVGMITPGSHVLAFYAMGQAFHSSDVAAAMISHPGGPAASALRQYPRDDFLGGAPRQGQESTSVQGSARQGWRATYR